MAWSLLTGRKSVFVIAVQACLLTAASAQTIPGNANPASSSSTTSPVSDASNLITHTTTFPRHAQRRRSPYSSLAVSYRARDYYRRTWGVDLLSTKLAESGQVVRFNYRIVDPEKAKILNDKKFNPVLIDEIAHVRLAVPSLEKVGELRQSSTPEVGKIYWMAFSNRGAPVKRGDRVSVAIGKFRADGLIVE
jgi:hypothetical protein